MSLSNLEIANSFQISGQAISAEPYSCGHINDTFLLKTDTGEKYILQRINTSVFKNAEALMNNIMSVTNFLKEKILRAGGDPSRETLSIILTNDGRTFYRDGQDCWRIYTFIRDSVTLQTCENEEQFYASACAFGRFQKLLADFPADSLYESIPAFHNTKSRYNDFEWAVSEDVCGRAASVAREIAFVRSRRDFAATLVDMQENGDLPLRVTHNDTKLNNVLFDSSTMSPIAVVDLDTVMPGLSINDFGDSIRFGATHAAEDEPDVDKVHFEIDLFDCYTRGFLGECGALLTENEKKMLPVAAMMMTFECGMRFLTDYLNGDTYFKIHRENHNLDRCHTQFKLVSDMEKAKDLMDAVVRKYC
ncbi:MAG: aminoglycoside phosphotransferase family protein [Lachnospiraceae bacterium]|nr:aminoglycoside phosphotransferase family protein [Lachnospiraceae bacterium]